MDQQINLTNNEAYIDDLDDELFFAGGAKDVTTLLADTRTYTTGTYIRTRKEGYSYRAVASGGDIVTAGGQNFEAQPLAGVYFPNMVAVNTTPGTTDMTSAINTVKAKGPVRGNPGETYLFSTLTLATGNALWAINLECSSFGPSTSAITIGSASNVILEDVFLDLGDDQTNGSTLDSAGANGYMNNAQGISTDDPTRLTIRNIEVTGAGSMSVVFLNNIDGKKGNIIDGVLIRDFAFNRTTSFSDDHWQGLYVNNCSDLEITRVTVHDATNTNGSNNKFTRGVTVSGCTHVSLNGGVVARVDQGVDYTGSAGNLDCSISNYTVDDPYSVGVKHSSSAVRCQVVACRVTGAGRAAFLCSGPAESGLTHKTRDITYIGCTAVNAGAVTTEFDEANRLAAGFYCEKSNFDQEHPQGVTYIGCTATDSGSTMRIGFHDDTIPTESSSRNRLVSCQSTGHTESFSVGFREDYDFNGGSAQTLSDNTWTVVEFTNTPHDNQGARGIITTSGSEDCYYVAPDDGTVIATAAVWWGQSSAGIRDLRFTVEGTGLTLRRAQVANTVHLTTEITDIIYLEKGEKLRLEARQTSGGDLTISPSASRMLITPIASGH
ncbi:MAG: hypothetical protein AAGP08_15225 [Pseudomonadota bacterium]